MRPSSPIEHLWFYLPRKLDPEFKLQTCNKENGITEGDFDTELLLLLLSFYSCCSHLEHRASVKRFVDTEILVNRKCCL
jgi:hypothetical protein